MNDRQKYNSFDLPYSVVTYLAISCALISPRQDNVFEDSNRGLKSDAVFSDIGLVFVFIPFKHA